MATRAASLALLTILAACDGGDSSDDGRRELVAFDCSSECLGLWAGSDAWSPVHPASEVEALPDVDPAGLWECEPGPDVDACVVVDDQGHRGCFWFSHGFAVAVAPACAVDGWLDAGNGMVSSASDSKRAHDRDDVSFSGEGASGTAQP